MPIVIAILRACLLLSFSPLTHAMDKTSIEGQWKFQYGDNANWSQPSWNDEHWPKIKIPSLLSQQHNHAINGWYRVRFDSLRAGHQAPQALLIDYIRLADETWLNGQKIGGKGVFNKAWQFQHTNPQSVIRVYHIPPNLLKPHDNLLAIKVSVGFAPAWGAMFPGGAGIIKGNVYIGDEKQLRHHEQNNLIQISSIDTIFIVLSIVDALIIILLLKNALNTFVEFRWLVFSSFIMMLGTSALDFFFIHQWITINTNFLLILALLTTPFSIALYFWSQFRDIKKRYIEIIFMAWLILCLIILIPTFPETAKLFSWYVWSALALSFFIYSFISAFRGVAIGRIGAIAQLLAISIYFLSIRTQWLPDTLFGHRNVQIGGLFYRYALLYAYFQQLRHIRLNYKSLSSRVVNIADEVRLNIARELHDGLGQHLASIKLQLQLTKVHTDSKHLTLAEQELNHSIGGLRRLINGLHPVAIDHYCISEALQRECRRYENIYDAHIHIDTKLISLEKPAELHIFRIFQECINNSLKHGKSSNIYIQFSLDRDYVELIIKDDGIGFDTSLIPKANDKGGFGFISLQERVNLLNGQLDIISDQQKGSEIHILFSLLDVL